MTCLRNPMSGIGIVREAARRARSCTGSGRARSSRSTTAMSTTWASKISWILSPTSVVHRLHVELLGEALLDAR